jgi:putative redox protein
MLAAARSFRVPAAAAGGAIRRFAVAAVDDAPTAQQLGELQSTFRANSDAAQARFSSSSSLTSGLRSTMVIRDRFTLQADEPHGLGGTDTAPNPVEILLASLGSCQEITYKAYASALGLKVTKVAVDVAGDIDLRGFLGVDPLVRPGFHTITGTVKIESTATDAQLAQLKEIVDKHCPVLDMLSSVPTKLTLQRI